ncbi:hypothetical protein DFH28DRAFT_892047 [Melampsora americana]|nr:hypothetical protein DFH28DRAFT_892047 [Melampsora americana]
MEPSQHKHVFPVPDIIQINHKDRRKMDEYVEMFPATRYGYRIRIGRSQPKTSPVSHYECHRSGHPKGRLAASGKSKSQRIDCPFHLSARYLYDRSSWILIHTHLGHNHPPDPAIKPRKKHHDPKALPILAPGVVMDLNDLICNQSPPSELQPPINANNSSNSIILDLGLDTNRHTDSISPQPVPECFVPSPTSSNNVPKSLEYSILRLANRLRAIPSDRLPDTLKRIDAILSDETPPPFHKTLPLTLTPCYEPSQPVSKMILKSQFPTIQIF